MSRLETLRRILEQGKRANLDVRTGEPPDKEWGGPEMVDVLPQQKCDAEVSKDA